MTVLISNLLTGKVISSSKLSVKALLLLKVVLNDSAREFYGLEIANRIKVSSGTLYPLLRRFEKEYGWLESRLEDVNPKEEWRPKRRIYRLTALGKRQGRKALNDFKKSI